MENQNLNSSSLDKKGIFRAMFFAILVALLGIGILGWQYRQIEKKQLPALEERIEEQKEKMEQETAEDVLDKFISARVEKNEFQAMLYLTEGAMEQKEQGKFALVNEFESYEFLKTEKLNRNKYRFIVKIYEGGGLTDLVEVITLIKILDKYYINSVEIAG